MAIELDKLKPYAQIVGDDLGRSFEQNGRFFTGSGQLWTPPPEEPPAPPEASEPPTRARRIRTTTTEPPAAPPSEADAQIAAQLGGQQG